MYDLIRSLTVEGLVAIIVIGMVVGIIVVGGLLFIIFKVARRSKETTR